jgi:hypothetical protein
MEPYVAHSNSRSKRHTEGLNGTIKVLVIDGVLIMPHSSRGVGHLVGKQAKAIVARVGSDPARGVRARPGRNCRLHSHGRSYGAKREIGDASHAILTVGSVVALVAFPGMSLAPGVFVRGDILRFGKIGGALVERSAVATRILRSRSSLQMRATATNGIAFSITRYALDWFRPGRNGNTPERLKR